MICGTQFDEEDYRASFDAINDLFGDRVIASAKSSFWSVHTGVSNAKK